MGDAQLGPLSYKTSLLWAEVNRRRAEGVLLWCDCCCLNQVAVSRNEVDAKAYALTVIAAIEECDMFWVHTAADYGTSLYTVLELMAWHAIKGLHPKNTCHLNVLSVKGIAGRAGVRLPIYDEGRDHGQWLRGQLRKHGEIGSVVIATFRERAKVDVRDAKAVASAFAALAAVSASAAAPPSYFAPCSAGLLPSGRAPSDNVSYGWIDRPREWPEPLGRPPLSRWTPPNAAGHLYPGLVSHADESSGRGGGVVGD